MQDHPNIESVLQAHSHISKFVRETPLLESEEFNALIGGRVLIKVESLQYTGSFKYRGATNKLCSIANHPPDQGVVAWSSGNHGVAIAAAASKVGRSALVVVPYDAPKAKLNRIRYFKAETVFYDRYTDNREVIARNICEERDWILAPSFDDADVIAGQGTCGFEIINECKRRNIVIDSIFICCGGGGLAAGICIAFDALSPKTKLFAVEPLGYDDTRQSLSKGEPVMINVDRPSICDALLINKPGLITFEINRRHLSGCFACSDEEVLEAMALAYDYFKIVVEPSGAIALAAIASRKIDISGQTVVATVTGGNADRSTFASALNSYNGLGVDVQSAATALAG